MAEITTYTSDRFHYKFEAESYLEALKEVYYSPGGCSDLWHDIQLHILNKSREIFDVEN